MRVIRRKTIFLILLYLFFFILPFFLLTTKASLIQEEVPISVNVNANISQGLIYIAPLPQQTQVFGQNYYVSNSLGYYEYSYLFSTTPPLLVWYEPAPSSQTYYFVYGGSTQATAVTTGVFSFYTQFYYLNTSIFNVSGVSLLGGSLVLNGQNSLVTFTTTALRYTSAVILYNFQSSAVITPPELIYSGSIPPGSIVAVSLFSYSNSQTIPSYTAFPFGSTTWVMGSDDYVKSSQFSISNSQFTYNEQVAGMPNEEVGQVALPKSSIYGVVFGSSVSLQYPSTEYLAPQTVAPSSVTFNGTFAVAQSASYGTNSVLLENPVYFFDPTLLNGSNILVYNDSKLYSLPVQASNLKLDLNQVSMYILPYNSSSNYIYFDDIPVGSTITVKYANGSTYSVTASGQAVNTVGGVSLVNLKIYGRNVVGITIQPSLTNTQVNYNMLVGFTDFLHKAGLIVNTTGVYVYNSQTAVTKLVNSPKFPADVGVGYADVGSTFYLIGFYYYPGSFYTFITPMPNAVASTGIVPYVNYNGTIPLSVSSIGITLSSGLYYETTGIISITTGLPSPLQSSVLSLTTAPGEAIVNNNNAIYQTKLQNSSSSLTLIGFTGYNLIIQYGSIESQLIISSNYYPTNLPTNLQVVVTVSESTRTVTISTSPLPVKPVQVASLNVTNVTTTKYNGSSGASFITNVHSTNNQLIGIITYYSFLAVAVASYRYSSQLWSSTLFLSFATLSIGLLFADYIVLPFAIGAVVLGFIFKRLNL
jgi:hypothetical protein